MAGMFRRGRGEPGRHRLGTPGLYHCSQLVGVREQLMSDRPTHRRPSSGRGQVRWLTTVGCTVLLGTLTVGGWLTANGATAMADMIGR
jgi:hypothetical protein